MASPPQVVRSDGTAASSRGIPVPRSSAAAGASQWGQEGGFQAAAHSHHGHHAIQGLRVAGPAGEQLEQAHAEELETPGGSLELHRAVGRFGLYPEALLGQLLEVAHSFGANRQDLFHILIRQGLGHFAAQARGYLQKHLARVLGLGHRLYQGAVQAVTGHRAAVG